MPNPSAKGSEAKASQEREEQGSEGQVDLAFWRRTYAIEKPFLRKDLTRQAAGTIAFHKANGMGHLTTRAGRVVENLDPLRGRAEREAWDEVVPAWATSMRRKGYVVKATLQEAHFPKPQQSGREWVIEISWPADAPTKK